MGQLRLHVRRLHARSLRPEKKGGGGKTGSMVLAAPIEVKARPFSIEALSQALESSTPSPSPTLTLIPPRIRSMGWGSR